MDPLKLIIVEDEVLIARHLEEIVTELGHKVIGVAHDSETALDMLHSRTVDMAILDIMIDGSKDGIEVAQIINDKYDIPFLFLTALSDLQTLDRARQVHPSAYLVKPFRPSDLQTSITVGFFNFQNRQQNKELTHDSVNAQAHSALSEIEFEVLIDITQGFTNAQIAKKRHVALSTIKWHVKNIYSKLGVKNRGSAINKILG